MPIALSHRSASSCRGAEPTMERIKINCDHAQKGLTKRIVHSVAESSQIRYAREAEY